MEEANTSNGTPKVVFSFFRFGVKVEGHIIGRKLPTDYHFIINFPDAETIFVEAIPKEEEAGYYFLWNNCDAHKYAHLMYLLNEIILKHFSDSSEETMD